ncbi:hypothetical protein SAMN02787144_100812 [Streptomyces atratus]|uniref:Cytochrome P450 n=1 Tax=Streptomyces atratus TaxID=1893 RepID=A0A1K2B441_STRAR|nr:hypothetical protein SAMN02787144_100812 [Streptomyces atratus]
MAGVPLPRLRPAAAGGTGPLSPDSRRPGAVARRRVRGGPRRTRRPAPLQEPGPHRSQLPRPGTPDELRSMAYLLLSAGHGTTVNLIADGVHTLLRHPGELRALRTDFTLLDAAVEEMLRYEGPIEASTFRFAVEPVEIGDTVILAGDSVLVARVRGRHPLLPRCPTRPHGGPDRPAQPAGAVPGPRARRPARRAGVAARCAVAGRAAIARGWRAGTGRGPSKASYRTEPALRAPSTA